MYLQVFNVEVINADFLLLRSDKQQRSVSLACFITLAVLYKLIKLQSIVNI